MKLREGSYYKTHHSVVVGPAQKVKREGAEFPWLLPHGGVKLHYRDDGTCSSDPDDVWNLACEVPAPGTESPKPDKDWLGTGYSKAYWRARFAGEMMGVDWVTPEQAAKGANALLEELEKTNV